MRDLHELILAIEQAVTTVHEAEKNKVKGDYPDNLNTLMDLLRCETNELKIEVEYNNNDEESLQKIFREAGDVIAYAGMIALEAKRRMA
jgi:RNAse (barnase) inhibitor barstar